jgi:hypothetical protein
VLNPPDLRRARSSRAPELATSYALRSPRPCPHPVRGRPKNSRRRLPGCASHASAPRRDTLTGKRTSGLDQRRRTRPVKLKPARRAHANAPRRRASKRAWDPVGAENSIGVDRLRAVGCASYWRRCLSRHPRADVGSRHRWGRRHPLSGFAYLLGIAMLARAGCASPALGRSKELEVLVLRHQLQVVQRQVTQPRLGPADRVLLAALRQTRSLEPRHRRPSFRNLPGEERRWRT